MAGDTNDTGGPFGGRDVFVRDRTLGITRRVSVRTGGAQAEEGSGLVGAVISADGRWVAFSSDATNLVGDDANGHVPDIYLHRLATQTTRLVSVSSNGTQANQSSGDPDISADGRYVAFRSTASNLVPCDTNQSRFQRGLDVFRHDRVTGTTVRFSVGPNGEQLDAAVKGSSEPSISAGGQSIAFSSDARDFPELPPTGNLTDDIFIHEPKPTGPICCGP